MIYIVSGFKRSGTSMMMKALEAGGLEAVYSVQRDERMNNKWGGPDYKPNERYYELEPEDYQDPSFPEDYESKLIKCLSGGMLRLRPVTEFRVVFMRRDQRSIVRSLTAFFSSPDNVSQSARFQQHLDGIIEVLRDRRSIISLHEFQYDSVVKKPLEAFQTLAEAGWPIDPEKAAQVPDKQLNRFGIKPPRENIEPSGFVTGPIGASRTGPPARQV